MASTPPCIEIRDEEIKKIHRRLVPLHPQDLEHLQVEDSWLMGVILCPGDGTQQIARFDKRTRAPKRIRFYLHPDTDISKAFSAWKEAGHKRARFDFVTSWQELHPDFGRSLNDQVYEDFGPS